MEPILWKRDEFKAAARKISGYDVDVFLAKNLDSPVSRNDRGWCFLLDTDTKGRKRIILLRADLVNKPVDLIEAWSMKPYTTNVTK